MANTDSKMETSHTMHTEEILVAADLNVRKAIEFDDPHKAAVEDNPEVAQKVPWTTKLAIFFLGMSTAAAITLPILVIPAILEDIGLALGDTTHIAWIASGWAVTSSVSCSISGKASDIFGRRYVIMAGQTFAIVGSIIAGTAKSVPVVIAGSSLMGVSCGLCLVAYAAVPELVPFKYRALALSTVEANLFIPWGVIAILLGNLLAIHASWRWPYYIATMYGVVSMVGTGLFYFPPARPRHDFEKTRWQEFTELDFVGLALYTIGLTILLIGFSWAGSAGHAWSSASVIAPIVLGFVLVCCCFAYDWFIVSEEKAFFPFRLFRRVREYTLLLLIVFIAGMVYYPMAILLPEATLFIFNNNGIQIGIISLPNGIGQFFGSFVMPAIMHKTKHPKWHLIAALTIQTLFTALYCVALPFHKAAWMAFQFFGTGCFPWITITTIFNLGLHVPHSDLGLAVGIIGTFRAAGGSLGDAIFTTILSGAVDSRLGPQIAEAALSHGYKAADLEFLIPAVIENALGVPGAFAKVPGITPAIEAATKTALISAYAHGFKIVFYSMIPFGVIALVATLLISDASKYMTNHTAVVLEKNVLGKAQHVTTKQVYGDTDEMARSDL